MAENVTGAEKPQNGGRNNNRNHRKKRYNGPKNGGNNNRAGGAENKQQGKRENGEGRTRSPGTAIREETVTEVPSSPVRIRASSRTARSLPCPSRSAKRQSRISGARMRG